MQDEVRRRAPFFVSERLSGYLDYLIDIVSGRWITFIVLAMAGALAVLRFVHLSADFPDWSPWMEDQAKFTDEGWWAAAAVRHTISAHWFVAGDYNPAAALPIWPMLLAALFRFTGASVVAARVLNVGLSVATMPVSYLLVRRYTLQGILNCETRLPAALSVLLLAGSPFAFVFARLAILETLVIFEFCVLLLIASYWEGRKTWPLAATAAVTTAMLLTKTTAALLIPAVLWMAWCAQKRSRGGLLRAALALVVMPAVLVEGYAALVGGMGHGEDYHYFFSVNSMPEFLWSSLRSQGQELFMNGFWLDRMLYPAALLIFVVTLAWKRGLWGNPLFAASWIAFGLQALFIVRRVDDYAPRYFLVMLPLLIWIAVLTLNQLMQTARKTALLLIAVIVASVSANAVMISSFMVHPTYDLRNAAQSIAAIIHSHPEQNQLMLGVSAPQISLMTGIAAINDFYGTEDGAEKVALYQPGWYLVWNKVDPDNEGMLGGYRLEEAARYPAFDDDDRTTLILYRMVRGGGGR